MRGDVGMERWTSGRPARLGCAVNGWPFLTQIVSVCLCQLKGLDHPEPPSRAGHEFLAVSFDALLNDEVVEILTKSGRDLDAAAAGRDRLRAGRVTQHDEYAAVVGADRESD